MSNTVINTNTLALSAHRNLTAVGNKQATSSGRLASGLRINSAADDAAGLSISEKMRAQIRGLDQASTNSQDAISLIQTAEGGMEEVDNMLQRIRELVVQASNDTNDNNELGTGDRQKIQDEIDQLIQEIDSMSSRVEFNNKTLLDGSLINTTVTQATLNKSIDSLNAQVLSKASAVQTLIDTKGADANLSTNLSSDIDTAVNNALSQLGFTVSTAAATTGTGTITATTVISNSHTLDAAASGVVSIASVESGKDVALAYTITSGSSSLTGAGSLVVTFTANVTITNGTATTTLVAGDSYVLGSVSALSSASTLSGSISFTTTSGGTLTAKFEFVETSAAFSVGDTFDISSLTGSPTPSAAIGTVVSKVTNTDTSQLQLAAAATGTKTVTGTTTLAAADSGAMSLTVSAGQTNKVTISIASGTSTALSGTGSLTVTFDQAVTIVGSTGTAIKTISAGGSYTINSAISDLSAYDSMTESFSFVSTSGGTVNMTFSFADAVSEEAVKEATVDYELTVIDDPDPLPVPDTATATIPAGLTMDNLNSAINVVEEALLAANSIGKDASTESEYLGELKAGLEDLRQAREGYDYFSNQLAAVNDLEAKQGSSALYFQVGANASQGILVNIGSVNSKMLGIGNGVGGSTLDILKASGQDIDQHLLRLDNAISYVSTERSKLGATQNRLEYTINSLETSSENLTSAKSRITDTDMAKEMMNLTQANVLQQAATSMLAQANQAPQNVLQLLQ